MDDVIIESSLCMWLIKCLHLIYSILHILPTHWPEYEIFATKNILKTGLNSLHFYFPDITIIIIRERPSITSSRGATHWSGEVWHMMMPVLRQGWVVKQNMTWWWYFVAILYRNIIKLSNHLQGGILTVTYCTFWIDITNIIDIFVFHSHFFLTR